MKTPLLLNQKTAKALWIQAQGLHEVGYFGRGPRATTKVIDHLGYVQIDTINVIERCHHHILYSRIPNYKKEHLHQAQSQDKTIFEYWTHALSYIPTKDFRYFQAHMAQNLKSPSAWYSNVKPTDLQKVFRLIKKNGPISIRDIQDDVLVEKDHEWASRKPSKRALQLAFNQGRLVISERVGMLKKYELAERHFNWEQKPRPATRKEINEYQLQRALRSQAVVSLDSICHLDPSRKPEMQALIEKKISSGELRAVHLEHAEKIPHWIQPEKLDSKISLDQQRVHILSPFDPLIIQRKRLKLFFDYQHIFEAYIPKEKRVLGYFALPVLMDDKIVAALDLKIDRLRHKLLIQKWTWMSQCRSAILKKLMEAELHQFEKFQLQGEKAMAL